MHRTATNWMRKNGGDPGIPGKWRNTETAVMLGNNSRCGSGIIGDENNSCLEDSTKEIARAHGIDIKSLGCDDGVCVLEAIGSILPSKQLAKEENRLVVVGPTHHELCDDDNLDVVCNGFMVQHDKFFNLGFSMIDFERPVTNRFNPNLRTTNFYRVLADNYPKKKYYASIVNTDISSGGGIHWFVIFINMSTKGTASDPFVVEYYNSSGNLALPGIIDWFHALEMDFKMTPEVIQCVNGKCRDNVRRIPKHIIFRHVGEGLQSQPNTDNNSCGIRCLIYIGCRLNGYSPNYFDTKCYSEEEITAYRKIFYRKALSVKDISTSI